MSDTTLPAGGQPEVPSDETDGPFQPGVRVGGRYTIEDQIGMGGMGVVYRARQDFTHKVVALKVIRPTRRGTVMLERFLDEIRLLGRLDHHGLVTIHDADLHHDTDGAEAIFFTMDLIEGVPITTWVEQRKLDGPARLSLMVRICEAMQYAHDHGVIHCDLKPANLLVRRTGDPVVIDFGLAYLRSDAAESQPGAPSSAPPAGLGRGLAGTPRYMSPEQFQGGVHELRAGQSVDVYALGLVTFELLAGRLPYDLPATASLHDIRRAVLFGPAHKLREVLPDVDPELDRVVAKALRKDPADRYYSVAQFLRALTRFLPLVSPAPEPEWQPAGGRTIPSTNWILDERLGEGGVGEVWTCHHRTLKHQRIVKFCADEEKASFLRREMTLYRLLKEKVGQNPHFARLEEVALDEPPRYLMSEYIEALDLAKWHAVHAAASPVSEAAVLEIVAQAADALQAAHDAGVLHRDIKPSNLLLRGNPADIASLHVWVGDFGIGQVISEELLGDATRSGFTRTLLGKALSSYSGTHFYMAPELLAGGQASVRSDIYALGVVLYQALTGDFQRAVTIDWASDVRDPLLRDDLGRCFARDPAARFPSAAEFADHLRRIPERRVESERAAQEAAHRERRAYRRGLARAGALAAVIVAGVSALAGFALHQKKVAQQARTETLKKGIEALRYSVTPGKQKAAWTTVEGLAAVCPPELQASLRREAVAVKARPAFDFSPVPTLAADRPRWLSHGLESGAAIESESTVSLFRRSGGEWKSSGSLPSPPGPVQRLVLSDQAQAAAAWLGGEPPGSLSVAVALGGTWRRVDGPLSGGLAVADAAAAPGSTGSGVAAVARLDGTIEIHRADRADGPSIILAQDHASSAGFVAPRTTGGKPPVARPATVLAFDSTARLLVAAGRHSLHSMIWDVENGALVAVTRDLQAVTTAAWNPQVSLIGTSASGGDAPAKPWIDASPEARHMLATGSEDGSVALWDLSRREGPHGTTSHLMLSPTRRMSAPSPQTPAVQDIAFASAGRQLMVLYADRKLGLFEVETGAFVDFIAAPEDATGLHVGRDRHWALQTTTGEPSYWATLTPPVFEESRVFSNRLTEVDSDAGGRLLVARGHAGLVLVDAMTLRPLRRLEKAFGNTARFGPETDSLLVIGGGTFLSWNRSIDPADPDTIRYQRGDLTAPHKWVEMDVTRLGPGRRVAAVAGLDTITVRTTPQSEVPDIKVLPRGTIRRHRIHPGGEWIAVIANEPSPAFLVNIPSGSTTALPHPASTFLDVAFSPDGRFLALRDAAAVHVFAAPSWTLLFALEAPSRLPDSAPIAFSHDSSLFVVAGETNLPVLYHVPPAGAGRWSEVASLLSPHPRDPITFHFGGPGHCCLYSGTADGYLQSWNIAELRRALNGIGLDWSGPEWHWPADRKPLNGVEVIESQ